MKKTLILGAALLGALGAAAQVQVVKDAEQAFKGVKNYADYQKVVQTMTPAFTNPETQYMAQTWFVPGKAGFDVYDEAFKARTVGNDVNAVEAAKALMEGYNYMLKALPADSVPDAKGKVKPKYSKKIIGLVVGHCNDFDQAAVDFYNGGEFGAACDAWDALLNVRLNPVFNKTISELPDSNVVKILHNQITASIQGRDYPRALGYVERVLTIGSDDPAYYEQAAMLAHEVGDKAKFRQFSEAGLKKFGTSDPKFLQWTVNSYIDEKQFDQAEAMLRDAIAADPSNSAYYFSQGVLLEAQDKKAEARDAYTKATTLDAKNANAFFNLGRMLAEENDRIDQEQTGNMSPAEYSKFFNETLKPLLEESAKNFETAYQLDPENMALSLQYLRNIYYVLKDNANLQKVEALLNQ